MANHYFTNKPDTTHDYQHFTFDLKGKKFKFVTDSGVFSKSTIDFGSRLLIDAFNGEDLVAGPILDVGCGYGPMGLSLAYATERLVEMVDVNERALMLAKENADRNGIANVDIHESYIYEKHNQTSYAAIISNPPIRAGKAVVHEILTGAYDLLRTDGTLTIVIQKKQGAPSAMAKMKTTFGNATVIKKDKGYYIIQSIKEL